MRTFLLLLVGLGLIAAYFYTNTPEFRSAAREKFPALDKIFAEPNGGAPQTVPVPLEKLAGAWLSEDGSELLFFREDGKFRGALGAQFKNPDTTRVFKSANIMAVMLGDYSVKDGTISTSHVKVTGFRHRDLKFDVGSEYQFKTSADEAEQSAIVRKQIPKDLEQYFNNWATNYVGGGVTKLTQEALVIHRNGAPVPFRRIDPKAARDPGTNGKRSYDLNLQLSVVVKSEKSEEKEPR